MATNLIRDIGQALRRVAVKVGGVYGAYKGYKLYRQQATLREQRAAAARRTQRARAIKKGVHRAVRSLASGSRKEIADKIRQMRKDPHQRVQLRRRIRHYTPVVR